MASLEKNNMASSKINNLTLADISALYDDLIPPTTPYKDLASSCKVALVHSLRDLVLSAASALAGDNSNALLQDLLSTMSHEPHEEPEQDENLYPLSFVPVPHASPATLEDNVIRALLSTPAKNGGEYRALQAALCQTHTKKDINDMLKKWQVVEHDGDLSTSDMKEASKRLRINADEYRSALHDYHVLTSSNANRLVQTFPDSNVMRKARKSCSSDSPAKRRGITPRYKGMLLQEFVRLNGVFTISDAVLWLKQSVAVMDEDFPSDKQIRGYISILRMSYKKNGTVPPLKAAVI